MGQLFLGATVVVLLFAGGYVRSVPFFDIGDEFQSFKGIKEPIGISTDDFGDTVITGDDNPFFNPVFSSSNNPFFRNPFGNVDLGFNDVVPWWKGENVCSERDDEEKVDEEEKEATADLLPVRPPGAFGGFHFSVNSCTEKGHKQICKSIYSHKGQSKILTITRQCCHGYRRPPNAKFTDQCEKFDLKTFEEAAIDMGGNEFIRSMKNNGLESMLETNMTIFLPTNDAFTKFSEQMFENNLVYVPMGGRRRRDSNDQFGFTSKDLLKSHIVDGFQVTGDMAPEEVLKSKLENSTIRINVFPRPRDPLGNLITANCAPMTKYDQIVTNGVVHSIDRVLSPVTNNVMDIIRQRSDMAVLRTLLEKTNLSVLLEGKKPVTLIAPTDKAFENLDMNLRKKLKEGNACAANILKYHIFDFTFCSEAAPSSGRNLLQEFIRYKRVANEKSEFDKEDIIINGLARIVERDIMATNGVIQVVDAVLPSDSTRSVSSLMEEKNVTIFKQLLELSGLESEFNDYENATIFAPTDKAFEDTEWAKKLAENPEQLKNSAELRDYLRGHVIQPKIKTCDLTEDMIKSVAGSDLRVNLYSTHSFFTAVMNRATVNCARLVHFDDESCGSVLHQVDRQLGNPKDDLLKMLGSTPKYSKFLEAVKLANLTDLLEDASAGYTIFLPNNEVFREFNIDLSSNKSEAERFVKDHIVNDIVCCAGIAPTNWPFVRTIEALSGKNLRINRDRRPKIENAIITKCDVLATNGIVHEINDVIITNRPQIPTFSPNNDKYDILRDVFF